MGSEKKRYSIYLPIKLVKQLDDARGDISRAKWVQRAIEQKLKTQGK